MSVITTSDEKITEAKELLKQASKNLMIAVDDDTYGSDQYEEAYRITLEHIMVELITLRRKL